MEKLSFLVGVWKATDTYKKTQFTPNGGSGAGIYQTVLGPRGNSVLTDYCYQGPHGESTGHQVLAWDPKAGEYIGYIVTSSSPGCIRISGNWDGADLVLVGEFEARGTKVRFRQVFSDISGSTMVLRQYNSFDEGPAQLFGTTRFTRQ